MTDEQFKRELLDSLDGIKRNTSGLSWLIEIKKNTDLIAFCLFVLWIITFASCIVK